MTPTRESVYQLVRRIPVGKVTTYGAIAQFLGFSSPRQIGRILRNSLSSEPAPYHRVIFANGSTATGYGAGLNNIQAQLLRQEGVEFLPNGNVNMKACYWQPGED